MKKAKNKKVKFGELEDLVMECVWSLCQATDIEMVDVKTVIGSLSEKKPDRCYVYTTIHTTCLRLCKKKRLEKVQIKNKYFYKPAETRDMAIKRDLMKIASKYFDGSVTEMKTSLDKVLAG